jgi:hypothetical protein
MILSQPALRRKRAEEHVVGVDARQRAPKDALDQRLVLLVEALGVRPGERAGLGVLHLFVFVCGYGGWE